MRYRSYASSQTKGVAVLTEAGWRCLEDKNLVEMIRDGDLTSKTPEDYAKFPLLDINTVSWLPPIFNPPKIICVGLNYVDHVAESPYKDLPKYPPFFPRFASTLVGHGQPIIRPALSHELDFEGELVVVIGKKGKKIKKNEALDYVFGYSIFNEGSIRDYQFKSAQWTVGKNFDNTGGFGPELVTPDELPKGAAGLKIETRLNGKVVQTGNTSDMIYSVADLISIASDTITLEPGDVFATGTPAGIGWARKPPLFMKAGDLCEVEIENIGVLVNPIKDEEA